ncbi:hypothetical protein MIMGU_mgv1a010846mg [Erythranthe guttata]|uniref:BHLH domain-containing protein n=2 Tax=Erythranthe guttata TaxID=4155 RepID=A0A022QBY7_ERYGU|nr:hypothetical protein MIMGU_mgv1a010846mg [Erythranthe guttata]
MSDLYGSNESEEDISSFLQILLQNPSSSAPPTTAPPAAGEFFIAGEAVPVPEPSSGIDISDPSCFFGRDYDGLNPSSSVKNLASSSEEPEGSDAPGNPSLPHSSKRRRAAEVHNLSEKRRRSRINEKLKALQNLIPNSNKTDKASMLDEAIEYLKQLQLQVQMLTMRNGLSLHPGYSLGSLQSMLAPSSDGLELNEQNNALLNANRGAGPLTSDQDFFIQHNNNNLEPTNQSSSNNQPMLVPSTSNTPPSLVPHLMQNHYGLLNHFASGKDICRDDNTLSRLQLDRSYNSGNNSSPGVSS